MLSDNAIGRARFRSAREAGHSSECALAFSRLAVLDVRELCTCALARVVPARVVTKVQPTRRELLWLAERRLLGA